MNRWWCSCRHREKEGEGRGASWGGSWRQAGSKRQTGAGIPRHGPWSASKRARARPLCALSPLHTPANGGQVLNCCCCLNPKPHHWNMAPARLARPRPRSSWVAFSWYLQAGGREGGGP